MASGRRATFLAILVSIAASVPLEQAVAAPSSRVEYGVEVGLICAEAEDDYARAFMRFFKRKGPGNIVPFLDRFNDVFEETTGKIATVPAAPGDEALVASWIDSLRDTTRLTDRTLPILRRAYRVLKRHDGEKTQGFRRLGRHFKRRNKGVIEAQERSEDFAKELTAEGCLEPAFF